MTAGPRGVVADYVPFYFAPRSPMMYKIHKGGVPTYRGDAGDLVYLCTTIEQLQRDGHRPVCTDRNAAIEVATFDDDPDAWETLVDWPLMKQRMWNNTQEDPERMERRMAECLVHGWVSWSSIIAVGVEDERRAAAVSRAVGPQVPVYGVVVRPDWYF